MIRPREWLFLIILFLAALMVLAALYQARRDVVNLIGAPVQVVAVVVTASIALSAYKTLHYNQKTLSEMARNRQAQLQPVLVPTRVVEDPDPPVTVSVSAARGLPNGRFILELQNIGNGPAVRARAIQIDAGTVAEQIPDRFYVGDGERLRIGVRLDVPAGETGPGECRLSFEYRDIFANGFLTSVVLALEPAGGGNVRARVLDVHVTT